MFVSDSTSFIRSNFLNIIAIVLTIGLLTACCRRLFLTLHWKLVYICSTGRTLLLNSKQEKKMLDVDLLLWRAPNIKKNPP